MKIKRTIPLLLLLANVGCASERLATTTQESDTEATEEVAALQEDRPIIEFQGEQFSLQSQTQNENEIVNEYIPLGESVDGNWTKMLALREFVNVTDARQAAGNLVQTVNANYPEAPVEIFTNEETGQDIVEFTLTGSTDSELFVEYNLFRYEPSPSGAGTIAYQYALRAYGDDTDAFLPTIVEQRGERLNAISSYDFPDIVQ